MISSTSLLFYINAAMEAVAVVFISTILVTSLVRKKADRTNLPFCLFTVDLILLLLCNLISWVLDGMLVSPDYLPGLYKLDLVLTVFDFMFYCMASVLFYNYIHSFISYVKNSGQEYPRPPKHGIFHIFIDGKEPDPPVPSRHHLVHILAVYTLCMTILFASSMNNEWFYYFPADGLIAYTSAYWVLIVFSVPAVWLSFLLVFRNMKVLGRVQTVLFLAFLILPVMFLVIDQLFSLSISYLSLAIISFTIYLRVDVEQDREMAAQEVRMVKGEAERNEMKMNLMMAQIQPHFLYNTLSTIAYLCRHDPKEAELAVNEFSDYLSGNLDSINAVNPVPFVTELSHVENYLKIQKRRFPDRVQIEYDIQAQDFEIPSLTLQPVVENVIKHVVGKRLDMTTIWIQSGETEESFFVTVRDDGPGFDATRQPNDARPHIGIMSTRSRLANMVNGQLDIESTIGVGTTARIIIPKDKEEKQT
ncbi:MAG: histidine kinase [Clostridia bacterium]|nr:histidine kinase [Clostridia bacterium]